MKSRIGLATGLVLLAALGVVAFQAYWTYQTYQQATRRLQQDSQAALIAATERAVAAQNARLLTQYRHWLQDTTHVRLSCSAGPNGETIFKVAGIPARPTDAVNVGYSEFQKPATSLTPAAKAFFINRFVNGTVRTEIEKEFTIFHTQWLGQQLHAALQRSHTGPGELRQLFEAELRSRGVGEVPFHLQLRPSSSPDSLTGIPAAYTLSLRPVRFGQRSKQGGQVARVWLPAGPGAVLQQLQGGLLASGVLVVLVLGGAGYAVGTMRQQRQLAVLKADFTHNLTHELKTPVATIQLAADSLRLFAPDARTSAEYAALIGEQAGRLGTLIDRILQSVALERAALPLTRQPVALLALAETLAAQHRPRFERAGHQLGWQAPAAAATVLGDATHLGSALGTLLDNALHYGGPRACLRAELHPTEVQLHLHDNGPGIAATYQERIFEQFFRVPTGNLHAVKGYGLGLHYARQIAQAHGGALTVRSQPGRGTTFTLTLPLLPSP